ncbi:MAG: response regulator, partial [Vampirovibrionia bacterium]
LTSVDIIVDIATNGQIAIDKLKENQYDLILMDIQMPVMDGIESTKQIRKNNIDTPIIAMTAHAMFGDRENFISSGMNDYISKPIKPEQLFLSLKKYITKEITEQENITISTNINDNKIQDLTHLPGISLEKGLKRVNNNKILFNKLLLMFKEENKNTLLEIKEFIDNNDYERALKLLHTVKGVAGNLGADELYNNIHNLELALSQNTDLSDSIDTFRDSFNEVINGIEDSITYSI